MHRKSSSGTCTARPMRPPISSRRLHAAISGSRSCRMLWCRIRQQRPAVPALAPSWHAPCTSSRGSNEAAEEEEEEEETKQPKREQEQAWRLFDAAPCVRSSVVEASSMVFSAVLESGSGTRGGERGEQGQARIDATWLA
mmetsp:Transcript_51300/g.164784  ORF Transcript_51300/g.164784 Transcript_51300/m.164784 type:complete len:140 (-) Transcript_51300:271-690(-)